MRLRIAVPERHVEPGVIDAALEAVTRLDEHMIRNREVPSFDDASSKVRWRPENFGDEHFDHAGTVLSRGWGDCDDLAPWKAASLRSSGEDPGATARVVPSGPDTFHAIVQRSDGSFDDPSVTCGMKATRKDGAVVGGSDGESIHITARDPHDGRIYEGSLLPTVAPMLAHAGPQFAARRVSGGFEGRCDIPWKGSPTTNVVGYGPVHVRNHYRHASAGRHGARVHAYSRALPRRVSGDVPYALSCTAFGCTQEEALANAAAHAVLVGDAADSIVPIDRYKLLAQQSLFAGMPVEDVTWALAERIVSDCMPQASDQALAVAAQVVREMTLNMRAQLARQG